MHAKLLSSATLSLVSCLAIISDATPLSETSSLAHGPRPYTINVDPKFIEQTRVKAGQFRQTVPIRAPDWAEGPPTAKINAIAKYWAGEYDWAKVQNGINKNFSHFYTTVPSPGGTYKSNDSLGIHFIHQRSQRADAIPILFLHGWPSTSLEWENIIVPLTNPKDKSQPAFHVVAPDIPGYGFSPSPKAPGLDRDAFSKIFANLMEQLGYDRYVLYSTDLGFVIANGFIVDYADRIIQHITDFYLVYPTTTDLARYAANQSTPEESAYISSINAYLSGHSAYAQIHSTLPLSLAYALNDSPVGFLAWRYQLAASVGPDDYTYEQLITDALLLYIPGVYGNIRSYKELFVPTNFTPSVLFTVPTAILQFGGVAHYPELGSFNFVPKDWVQRYANVTYFKRYPHGGHFPALAEPQLVIDNIRAVLKK